MDLQRPPVCRRVGRTNRSDVINAVRSDNYSVIRDFCLRFWRAASTENLLQMPFCPTRSRNAEISGIPPQQPRIWIEIRGKCARISKLLGAAPRPGIGVGPNVLRSPFRTGCMKNTRVCPKIIVQWPAAVVEDVVDFAVAWRTEFIDAPVHCRRGPSSRLIAPSTVPGCRPGDQSRRRCLDWSPEPVRGRSWMMSGGQWIAAAKPFLAAGKSPRRRSARPRPASAIAPVRRNDAIDRREASPEGRCNCQMASNASTG